MLFMVLGASNAWAADETITFADNGYSNAQAIETVQGTNFTITFDKGTNSNAPKYYTSGSAIRVYGGNTFTVSSVNTITEIVLGFGSSDGDNDITTGDDAYDNGTWTGSENEVTFTVGGSKGNRRIASIKVTYETGGAQKTDVATEVSVKAPESLNVGDEGNFVLNATYAQNATYTVAWESSKPEVLAVNGAAYEAKAAGKAEVTVKITPTDQNTYNEVSHKFSVTVVDPNANDGSAEHPYTVAEARAAIDAGTSISGVYAKGIVSKIVTAYNSQYGNITYDISADGTTEVDQLRVYRGFSYNGEWFTSEDDIQVGDVVVIKGDLTKYNSTYEFTQGNQLVSLERPVQPTKTETTVTISGELTNLDVYTSTEAGTLTATVKAGNDVVEGATVTWSSSNENVATIDQDGKVTLIAKGTVTFTAAYAGDATYAKSSATTNEYTVTSSEQVVDYATLPFEFDGGTKEDLLALNGVTAKGLGSNYAESNAPYRVKFDTTDDYILIKTDSRPGVVTIGVKMLGGGNESSITVQGSADGENFTDIETLTISGKQNTVLTLETKNEFAENDRFVKMVFTKGSNVGVGPISITKYGFVNMTIGEAGWTSYVPAWNVNFPDVTAYIVTESKENSVKLTEVAAVKAGTPVLVEGTAGKHTLEFVAENNCDNTSANLLKASDGTVTSDGQTIFALGQKEDKVGLYLVGADVVIPAGKAYLQDAQATGGVKAFDFDGETAIQNVEATNLNAPIYNVAGQRVNKAVKGLYIQNGRKFIVK